VRDILYFKQLHAPVAEIETQVGDIHVFSFLKKTNNAQKAGQAMHKPQKGNR
jgi:hypothetical protein